MIKRITDEDDFVSLAKLLNIAFLTVARQFDISKENCPFHNAYITADILKSKLTPIREFYKMLLNDKIIGFIAIEKSETESATYYIEKVAVHPEFRNIGYGQELMNFATKRIIQHGGKKYP